MAAGGIAILPAASSFVHFVYLTIPIRSPIQINPCASSPSTSMP